MLRSNKIDVDAHSTRQDKGEVHKFGNDPIKRRCTKCSIEQFTRVDSKVSDNGWGWAILSCCFGCQLLSLLVLFVDGFRVYTHYCPSCNNVLGTYKSTFSARYKVLLALFNYVCLIGLLVMLLIYVSTPQMHISINEEYRFQDTRLG